MKLYKIFILTFSVISIISLAACSDFTDVKPKGTNLLSTTSELEMLLNGEYEIYINDIYPIGSDVLYTFEPISNTLALPVKNMLQINLTWDQEGKNNEYKDLVNNDNLYSDGYEIIGKICNPILSIIDEAEGSQNTKDRIKAEALTLRAYWHYLIVNKFAKAYNKADAATTPGIIYMTEEQDLMKPAEMSSVEEVYQKALADINEAIALDALPVSAPNRMRVNSAMAYAVKALILLSMQEPSQAAAAAKQALAISPMVTDYNSLLITVNGMFIGGQYEAICRPQLGIEEDYFTTPGMLFYMSLLPECQARFEPGYMTYTHAYDYDMALDYFMSGSDMILGEGINAKVIMDVMISSYQNDGGIKSSQMYCILAEDAIERGQYDEAMGYLDSVRKCRFVPSDYFPLEGSGIADKASAIKHLKQVVHGETFLMIHSFINRKRWNQLNDYKETYTRTLLGNTYTMSPESNMWIYPFPKAVKDMNVNVKDNY